MTRQEELGGGEKLMNLAFKSVCLGVERSALMLFIWTQIYRNKSIL